MPFIWLHKPCLTHIVIAGHNYREIASKMQGVVYRIGRIRLENAFAISFGCGYLLYVHRNYSAYRRLFYIRFGALAASHDVDHVLAKHISSSVAGRYILLARIPRGVNRSHGAIERLGLDPCRRIYLPKIFYMDSRIFQKLIGNMPFKTRTGFNPGIGFSSGVSRSQGKALLCALGLDLPPPNTFVRRLRAI